MVLIDTLDFNGTARRLDLETNSGDQLCHLKSGKVQETLVPQHKGNVRIEAVRINNLSGIDHEDYIRGVYNVLSKHVSPGELQHVVSTLPKELAELFTAKTVEV